MLLHQTPKLFHFSFLLFHICSFFLSTRCRFSASFFLFSSFLHIYYFFFLSLLFFFHLFTLMLLWIFVCGFFCTFYGFICFCISGFCLGLYRGGRDGGWIFGSLISLLTQVNHHVRLWMFQHHGFVDSNGKIGGTRVVFCVMVWYYELGF